MRLPFRHIPTEGREGVATPSPATFQHSLVKMMALRLRECQGMIRERCKMAVKAKCAFLTLERLTASMEDTPSELSGYYTLH